MPPQQSPDVAALHGPSTALPGVGPATAKLIEKVAGGGSILDLLFHLPDSYVDRRHRPTIRTGLPGQVATLAVEVVRLNEPASARHPWRVTVTDGTGFMDLTYWGKPPPRTMAPGVELIVSGKLDHFADRLCMPKPDHVAPASEAWRLPAFEPVWPLTAGLFGGQVRGAMRRALAAGAGAAAGGHLRDDQRAVLADAVQHRGEALGRGGGRLVVVAHVQVHERGAGLVGGVGGFDLLGDGHRHGRVVLLARQGTGDRDGNDAGRSGGGHVVSCEIYGAKRKAGGFSLQWTEPAKS